MITLFSTLLMIAAGGGPVPPEKSLGLMHVAPGIRVDLIASEPDVADPVAVAFDERGRMFVVENRGYPEDDTGAGRIALLTDDDGDGVYRRVSTFHDGLNFPNGVMAWKDGVIVTDAPHVLFLKDTTGDGIADVREVMLDGFSLGGSTQLRVSHPTLGLDNWIHFSNGLSGGDVRSPDESNAITMGLYDLRFNPFTDELETVGGRAQFGLTFDDFGHKFVCSNRNHIQHVVISPHDLARNPAMTFSKTAYDIPDHGAAAEVFPLTGAPTTAYAHAGTFTASCGLVIYRGTALPQEYQGNAFVCEPTGNLVHRDTIKPTESTFVASRGRPGVEFIASEDEWFRPVFLTNGPGGALYLCDMYRATIEHPTYLPGEVAATMDFGAGRGRGRIYRISGDDSRENTSKDFRASALLDRLQDADAWSRDTAHRLLLERQDLGVVPQLQSILKDHKSTKARVHALSLLKGLGAMEETDILTALTDGDSALREQGAQQARLVSKPSSALIETLGNLSRDTDGHVRFAAALALGDVASSSAVDHLVEILHAAPNDEWTQAAVLSGVHDSVMPFTEQYLEAAGKSEPDRRAIHAIGSMMARAHPIEEVATFADKVLTMDIPTGIGWKMSFLNGAISGARRSGTMGTSHSPIDVLKADLSTDATQRLDALVTEALQWAIDIDQPATERLIAIDLLGSVTFDTSIESLEALLTPITPAELQVHAIRSLFQSRDDRSASVVLTEDRWSAFTGQARDAALTGLLSTPDGVDQLLAALESKTVQAWSVPAQYRGRLLRHSDAGLQARAKALFSKSSQQDRMKVYEAHRPVLDLVAHPANGRDIFEKTCASCHRHGDLGNEVGPDLTGIGSQSSDSILLHILVPNWLKLPGYESYLIETDALEEFTGIIVAESEANITLRAAYGVENTIPRSSITSMKMMALSMMPAELEQTMTKQELRDLIAFLKREPNP